MIADQKQKIMDILLGMGDYIDFNELGILAGTGDKPAGITFIDYIKQRVEHRAVDNGTRRRYVTWLKYFEQWGGMVFFHQITARNINASGEWVAARKHAGGGRLPLVSNQKCNQFLKAMGQMIGERNQHSHMGRASCATIMRNAGLPMSVIQKVLGHTTLAQTERYASLMDSTVIEEMRRLK